MPEICRDTIGVHILLEKRGKADIFCATAGCRGWMVIRRGEAIASAIESGLAGSQLDAFPPLINRQG